MAMSSRLRFGTVSGIPLFVHWTFLVMLVGLFIFYVYQGLSVSAALMGVGLVLAVFGCVVLHELGHAFMAREFGIPTLDITMYPIGGIARLQRMPREPRQEFWIAVAGPAVNLGIAGALFLLTSLMDVSRAWADAMTPGSNILTMLMWVNLTHAYCIWFTRQVTNNAPYALFGPNGCFGRRREKKPSREFVVPMLYLFQIPWQPPSNSFSVRRSKTSLAKRPSICV